ncbi:hypothetical protein QOZ80_6BG0482890 [Eleusine coracana subsp. coracana]|nr:hypothetical protein QOZ80_6BG0482890 [Eleusine coracana subsp. coracana]
MSFGGMFDGAGSGVFSYDAGGAGMHNPGRLIPSPPIPKPGGGFASPGLSLGLQTNIDGGQLGDVSRLGLMGSGGSGSVGDGDSLGRGREDENDSRSGSDNLEGASGDELDPDNSRKKKKRYHRHTPQQIQELEAVFKECPHPDEKQRMELSKRLNLESRQVKFWFQNRRTQMKTQIERHENALLRQENDKLCADNMTIREAMRNPICANCGGAAVLGEVSLEEQHLRIENARLKDELDRVCALAGKFLGRPISSGSPVSSSLRGCSGLELGVGMNGFGLGAASSLPPIPDLMGLPGGPMGSSAALRLPAGITGGLDGGMHGGMHGGAADGVDRGVLLELGLAAMEELVKLSQMDEPLWLPAGPDGGGFDTLNFDEYHRAFARVMAPSPAGFVSEATREAGVAIISSIDLVDSLMDASRWSEMFPCIVARASTTDIISSGMGGTRSGSIQLMHAELQVLSPLVPIREVLFLRFCKQHAEGLWAVVDVSVDSILRTADGNHHHHHQHNQNGGAAGYMGCRLLPSGCIVQDMNNGYSKVTWVVHAEYDEAAVHQLYRPLLRSGQALGARRWLASLQRQCQYLAILCSNSLPARDHAAITPVGRRSMLKLAQRMTDNFCAGVCASAAQKWRRLDEWRGGGGEGGGAGGGAGEEKVRMMARQSVGAPGEPPGVVLSATTSVRLPATPPQRVFDYLRDEQRRGEWDILANGEAMQEMDHIAKGQHHGNAVSLLRPNATSGNQNNMLILQETCTDSSGSLVVYAPVDVQSMHVVMNGGDSAYVSLLPSGFAILPDGHSLPSNPAQGSPNGTSSASGNTGSLVTVAFQILVNSLPTAKLTVESVDTVSNLLSCTIQKIKSALQANIVSP